MNEIIKGEIPFVRMLLPLIAGISAAFLFASERSMLVAVIGFATTVTVFGGIMIFYEYLNIYKRRWLPSLLFQFSVLLFGYCLTIRSSEKLEKANFANKNYEALLIKVMSEPKLNGDILRFESKVVQGLQGEKFSSASGNLLIALKTNETRRFRYGDILMIPPDFNEIEPPYNPNEFDFKNYLANHATYYQAFIRQEQIQLLRRNAGNPVISFSYLLRQKLVAKFNQFIHDRDAAAVASTLILGYRADLSKDVLDAYSKTGTMHVLSVSGMHVGIVFIVLTFFLRFMERSKGLRLLRCTLMVFLIWFYAILTGFSPSVCRAAVMLTIFVLGKALYRRANSYNLVASSAVLLLLYNPYFLVDVGCQLSYLAVLGLIYLHPKIYHLWYIKSWVPDKIWNYSALSISAQAATFPASMFYFHQFPLYFLISNIFIVIPVTLIMYTGLAFIILPFDSIQQPLGVALEYLIIFTNKGLFYLENLPFASISGIWISPWYYLLIYLFLFLLAFGFLYRNKKLLYSSLLILLTLFACSALKRVSQLQQKQIVFYSLRKNTAIGFLSGSKVSVLSDLHDNDKTFAFSVRPSLEANGFQNFQTFSPGKPFSSGDLFSEGHFLQFRNWKLLVCDSTFNYKQYSEPVFVDAVLFRQNPKLKIKSLASWLHFNSIFVDGTNPDYKIHQWQKEGALLGCKLYVLKKNPAFVVDL